MTVPGAINSERRNAPPQRRGNRFGEGWSFGNLLGGTAEDWENDMTTFITQARFTKDGLNGMIAAPGDRTEIVGRLIAQVGGKLIAHLPQQAVDRIGELLVPGSSLVVSDEGLGRETGRDTEFIVLTR
jgi:hypothetical protein